MDAGEGIRTSHGWWDLIKKKNTPGSGCVFAESLCHRMLGLATPRGAPVASDWECIAVPCSCVWAYWNCFFNICIFHIFLIVVVLNAGPMT